MITGAFTDKLSRMREEEDDEWRALYDRMVQHLIDSDVAGDALKAGDTFPDFQMPSAEGRFVRRADVLANGPAVLSFYRGAWCPYCSAELNALAEAAPAIAKAGAMLATISPEAGGAALRTKVERHLPFEILCDLDNVLGLECGLVFPMSDEMRKVYIADGLDLSRVYGNDAWMLPLPATYIVRQDAVIAKAFVDADFRNRLDPEDILATLAAL